MVLGTWAGCEGRVKDKSGASAECQGGLARTGD